MGVAKKISPRVSLNNYVDLVKSISAQIDVEEIRRAINEHDVHAAEALYPGIYETYFYTNLSPYQTAAYGRAFRQFIDIIVEANHNGVFFEDDMLLNWQLYPDHRIKDHQYTGVHTALTGSYDEIIFPQREFIKNVTGHCMEPNKFHYTSIVDTAAALKKARGF